MEKRLWHIFENINKWLEYSERKNALILTFIGIQLTLVRLFIDELNGLSYLSFLILIMCLLLAIISFFPKTSIPRIAYGWGISKKPISDNDNLVFYGDIAKYTTEQYVKSIETYFHDEVSSHRYLKDICNQIVVNSEITLIKYNIFKITTWLMGIGQLLFFVSLW